MKSEQNSFKPDEIFVTASDKEKLLRMIQQSLQENLGMDRYTERLSREIARAKVVESNELQPDVVTMHSRALVDLNGRQVELSLVYPQEAAWEKMRLSVLSPVGMAILGCREGDEVQWETPAGISTLRIKKVLYQPEFAGDEHV